MVEAVENQSKPISTEVGSGAKEISSGSILEAIDSIEDPDKKVEAARVSLHYLLAKGRFLNSTELLVSIEASQLPFAQGERNKILESVLKTTEDQYRENPIDAFGTMDIVEEEMEHIQSTGGNGFILTKDEYDKLDKKVFEDTKQQLEQYTADDIRKKLQGEAERATVDNGDPVKIARSPMDFAKNPYRGIINNDINGSNWREERYKFLADLKRIAPEVKINDEIFGINEFTDWINSALQDPERKVEACRLFLYVCDAVGYSYSGVEEMSRSNVAQLPFQQGERMMIINHFIDKSLQKEDKLIFPTLLKLIKNDMSNYNILTAEEYSNMNMQNLEEKAVSSAVEGIKIICEEIKESQSTRGTRSEEQAIRFGIETIWELGLFSNLWNNLEPDLRDQIYKLGLLPNKLLQEDVEVLPENIKKQLGIEEKQEPKGEDKTRTDKSQEQETIGDKDQLFKDGKYIEGSLRKRLSDPNLIAEEKQQIVLSALKELLGDKLTDNLVKTYFIFNQKEDITHQLGIFHDIDPVGSNLLLKSELMKMFVDIIQAKSDNRQSDMLLLFSNIHLADFREFLSKNYRKKVLVETQGRIMNNQNLYIQKVGILLADLMIYKDLFLEATGPDAQKSYLKMPMIFGHDEWNQQDRNEWKKIFFSSLTSYAEAIKKDSDVLPENIQFLKQEIEDLSKADKKQWYRDNQDLIESLENKGILPPPKPSVLSRLNPFVREGRPPPPAAI